MMNKQHIKNCHGLTLVELMIALLLSLLIMGGAISIFMSNKETFRLEEELSILQENYRFIADRFNKDFGNAAFTGCNTPYDRDTPTVNPLVSNFGPNELIQGVEGGGLPDSITINYALVDTGVPVVDTIGIDASAPVLISRNTPLFDALNDNFNGGSGPVPVTLLIGNCDDADIFLATGTSEVTGSRTGLTVGAVEHQAGVDVRLARVAVVQVDAVAPVAVEAVAHQ
jgi:type II secretory pathway pseudopilin PulG